MIRDLLSTVPTALLLLLPLLSPAPLGAQPDTTASTFVDRTEVRLIEVEVFVSDRKGRPIDDLELSDFIVRLDGEPITPTHFRPPRPGDPPPGNEEASATPPTTPSAEADDALVVPIDLGSSSGTDIEAPPEAPPRLIAFFVDHLAIQPHSRRRVLDRLGEYLSALDSSDDHGKLRFLVASYQGTLSVPQGFTDDPVAAAAALEEQLELAGPALARWTERQALMREGMQVLQTIGMANRATSPSQNDSLRNLAESQLGTLMRQVELYAEQLRQETARGVQALEEFVTAFAALPGRKALVHVSDGLPLRPGEELFWAMEEIFQGGRQLEFADPGGGTGGGATGTGGGTGAAGAGSGGGTFQSRDRINTVSFLTRAQRFDLTSDFRRLAAAANRHRVSFYPLEAGGRKAAEAAVYGRLGTLTRGGLEAMGDSNHQATLDLLAESTGGALLTGAAVEPFLDALLADFDRAYVLAWVADEGGPGLGTEPRGLTVKVRRPGARVRTRRTLVGSEASAQRLERTRSALFLGLESNPHQLELEVGPPIPGSKSGRRSFALQIRIPFDSLLLLPRGASHACDAQLVIATSGGVLQEVPLSIEIPNQALAATAGQHYTAELELLVTADDERVAVGFWDAIGNQGSYVAGALPTSR